MVRTIRLHVKISSYLWHQDRVSLSRKFDYYLARGNEYASLPFGSSRTSLSPKRRLLLIDDIPNVQSFVIKEAFHAALERFVESPSSTSCPLVIIISDAGTRAEVGQSDGNNWRSKQQDVVDFRSVFPKSLHTSPLVEQIALVTSSPPSPLVLTTLMSALIRLRRHCYAEGCWHCLRDTMGPTDGPSLKNSLICCWKARAGTFAVPS